MDIGATLDRAAVALAALDPDNDFKTLLRTHQVITSQQLDSAYSPHNNPTREHRVAAICDYIKRSQPLSYSKFRYCVIAIGRDDLVKTWLPAYQNCEWTPSAPAATASGQSGQPGAATATGGTAADVTKRMTDAHYNAVVAVKDELADHWDIDAVLNTLQARGVLNHHDVDAIEAERTALEKVSKFVKLFLKKDDTCFDVLLQILRDKKQQHIVSLITHGPQ